jgi:hypothetical protein
MGVANEASVLKSLNHKNILKLVEEITCPLPDDMLALIANAKERVITYKYVGQYAYLCAHACKM